MNFFSHLVFCLLSLVITWIDKTNSLIPYPISFKSDETFYGLTDSIHYEADPECYILQDAVKRFDTRLRLQSITLTDAKKIKNNLKLIRMTTSKQCNEKKDKLWPSTQMNQSYYISSTNESILIEAPEVWGALVALETLMQLVYKTDDGMLIMKAVEIKDEPRFQHRGFLLDTSRHYLPIQNILQFLDAMAMVKMNVFHWHIVDDNSFPYFSPTYPLLSEMGAFHPYAFIYTPNDVAEILEYARLRGIRVMPEFDTPGHSESWGKGYPRLLTACYHNGKPDGTLGPLNPAYDYTYEFMAKFLEEIMDVFPDELLHLGGDEVSYRCWSSNPDVKQFMEMKKFGTDYKKLEGYYIDRLVHLVQNVSAAKQLKRTTVCWEEIFNDGFRADKSTIIHVWKSNNWQKVVNDTTAAGFQVLFSSCWYLNYISYGPDWGPLYHCDPTEFGGNPEQINLVIGGEAAMWGEYVDETNLFSRSWPRGAAVAERLWSIEKREENDFSVRLDEFRCRMRKLGWNAEPINGPGYCAL